MSVCYPPTIDDLGVEGAADLLALLVAQARRRTIAPTAAMAARVVQGLLAQGVIETAVAPDDLEGMASFDVTPLEGIGWRYRWEAYNRTQITEALTEFLQSVPWNEEGLAIRIRRWHELAVAEVESYMAYHLARSRFDPAWAVDAAFAYRDGPAGLSIAQWRYCSWAGIRHGALIASREVIPPPSLRERIFTEMGRRAGAVSSGRWDTGGFLPWPGERRSAATGVFTGSLTRLGTLFFSQAPSLESVTLREPVDA